jgi:hypothetical protein
MMSGARPYPELRLSERDLLTESVQRRLTAIEDAIRWEAGLDIDRQKHHRVWRSGAYSICLAKPGKETLVVGDKYNRNDMLPTICVGNHARLEYKPTVHDMWSVLEHIAREDELAGELVGSLLVRGAYMLDQSPLAPNSWDYEPPAAVIDVISTRTGEVSLPSRVDPIDHVPFEVFLRHMDAVSLNEDVKYFTLRGPEAIAKGLGRTNNLLTAANLVAVTLRRRPIYKLLAELNRGRGVAPLSLLEARRIFPQLS